MKELNVAKQNSNEEFTVLMYLLWRRDIFYDYKNIVKQNALLA